MSNDVSGTIRCIEKNVQDGSYSLWHLFKDEQRRIFMEILKASMADIEISIRKMKEDHYPFLDIFRKAGISLVSSFETPIGLFGQ